MRPCKYLMDISPYPPLCDNPVRYYGGGATEARCSGCEWYEDAIAATAGRSCASCPEMDNPDSYISHLRSALKWHDEHVPRPTNPRNTCVVLQGEKPPEEVLFVRDEGGVTHYLPEGAVGNRTDLANLLREVTGLHAFAELFGFSWEDGSDWTWHDVACAMADAVDAATVGAEPDEATMLKLHSRMNAALLDMNEELLAYHSQDRENASSKKLIDCVIAAHQIIEDATKAGARIGARE